MMQIAKPFEMGLSQQKLLLPWCTSCGRPHFYPRSACPHCWGETYDWKEASGMGTIHSYTEVRANPPTAFSDQLPYTIAIIDLDDGVRILSNIVEPQNDLAIGTRVEVVFVRRDDQVLPMFRGVK